MNGRAGSSHPPLPTQKQQQTPPSHPTANSSLPASRIPKAHALVRSGSARSMRTSENQTLANGHDLDAQNYPLPSPSSTSFKMRKHSHSYSQSNSFPSLIRNEPPPFPPTPVSSHFDGDESRDGWPGSRRSSTSSSEERPFEHWYRGEVSRNGGVGELKVGKRIEMLDIANYGHAAAPPPPLSSRLMPLTPPNAFGGGRRVRQTSLSDRDRDSLYMDKDRWLQNKEDGDGDRVMDESPLTDLEAGSDESTYYAEAWLHGTGATTTTTTTDDLIMHHQGASPHARPLSPSSLQLNTPQAPYGPTQRKATSLVAPTAMSSSLPTPPMTRPAKPGLSRIPGPVRQVSEPHQTPPSAAGTTTARAGSEPPPGKQKRRDTMGGSPQTPSQAQVQGQAQKQNQKKRVMSPASAPSSPTSPTPTMTTMESLGSLSSSAKKLRTGSKPKTLKARGGKSKTVDRRSIAEYPAPQGTEVDLVDAIPTWTQPVEQDGNWDEVRLLRCVLMSECMFEHFVLFP
jgi:hypothetical protein